MHQSYKGYYRSPTVFGKRIVFVCEDDLWQIDLSGGNAQRLTNSRGSIFSPVFSPDGQCLACCGQEEGDADIYTIPAMGGPLQRITYLNSPMRVLTWSLDGKKIIFWSTHQSIHRGADAGVYSVDVSGGPVQKLPIGPAYFIDYSFDQEGILIGRNSAQNFRWKRYRGGTIGEIWIKAKGKRQFVQILQSLQSNLVSPFWIGERVHFVSDHEGIGNLYSCDTSGNDLKQETFQKEFYVRGPSTDGQSLVFHAGGDLFLADLKSNNQKLVEIDWVSPRTQLQRKFFYGDEYVDEAAIHPEGHSIALTARGSLFSMPLWEQAVNQHGSSSRIRNRLLQWLPDGRLATILDLDKNQEKLAVFPTHPQKEPDLLLDLPSGRVQHITSAPVKNQIVITTNQMTLFLIDIDNQTTTKLDSSSIREIQDVIFASDGNWLAYTKHLTLERTAIFLLNLKTKSIHQVTEPVRYDFAPAFDPEGQFLYFLSSRTYNPIADTMQTGVIFARSIKPYLITLQKNVDNPFSPIPHAPGKHKDEDEDHNTEKEGHSNKNSDNHKDGKHTVPEKEIKIDMDGIQHRILEFPVKEGLYQQILGLPHKAIFTEFNLAGELDEPDEREEKESGILWCYDFEKHEIEEQAREVSSIEINPSGHTLLYFSGHHIRVVEAGHPVPDEQESDHEPNRKTGWLDLERVRISVDYAAEWEQMFRETWRLQKEFFWRKDLSGIDWEKIYDRYFPLLKRIGSRSELSDIIWEMQGELGTSHAYEYGGDYRPSPSYLIGRLGADLQYNNRRKCYVLQKIYQGDVWKRNEHSPLCEPGQEVSEGDYLIAIGGIPVNLQTPPGQLLVNQAGQEVLLSIKSSQKNAETRHIVVKTMISDQGARYREWVNSNTRFVLEKTNGRVGYLHIPDMQTRGISEFHRGYLSQTDKSGLIIDVRYNAGGMVSPLILEKLAHRHLGYDVPRWGTPESYPYHTLHGHQILLANEFTGSDGDMFCQSFKALKLGKLIGKRTWGGVVGIDQKYQLVDGTTTTQPQYSAWFHDAEWSIENHGIDPDIKVEFPPHAYAQHRDPQLERSIEEMLELLEKEPVASIEFDPNTRQKLY
ncbi:MAG: PDZ domain-containing protein [SAR324 cluster bacterium]|nr:PDZ domain-containing protein [SAR324 cluster bacterium]